MLDPADVLADGQPLGNARGIERAVRGLAGEAQEVPARIDEGVERVGLAPRRMATLRAIDMFPRRVPVQRVAGNVEGHILGQGDGQVLLGHRHHAADLAMDERDRRAPIALAADAPITQAVLRLARAPAFGFGARDDGGLGGVDGQAVEDIGVDQDAVARLGLTGEGCVGVLGMGGDDADDRQRVLGGKFEVALVVAGDAHDGAGAIFHQHEVGDPHRQVRACERVPHGQPGIEAQLFGGFQLGCGGAALLAQRDEGLGLGVLGDDALRDRVIGGDGHKAGAEDRVRPGRVDLDRTLEVAARERELQTLRLADPVLLHQLDLLGPVLKAIQPFQQFLGEVGDLEEPLAELPLLDQRAAAPAAPVDHLLVGQHGVIDRVPVDCRFLAIDQPGLVQIEEQRLLLPVIIRLARGQLAAPVDGETEALQLRLHAGDVVAGPAAGMDALFHRRVLGGHAKGVPAHRVQHLKPLHPPRAREHVAHRVVAHVADMDPPRGVWKHLQDIGAGLGAGIIGAEALGGVPRLLPADVGGLGVELFGHAGAIAGLAGVCIRERKGEMRGSRPSRSHDVSTLRPAKRPAAQPLSNQYPPSGMPLQAGPKDPCGFAAKRNVQGRRPRGQGWGSARGEPLVPSP